MNRKFQTEKSSRAGFLAKASSISERASRAMRPNGNGPDPSGKPDLANRVKCNVITLRNTVSPKGEILAIGVGHDRRQAKLDRDQVKHQRPEGPADER